MKERKKNNKNSTACEVSLRRNDAKKKGKKKTGKRKAKKGEEKKSKKRSPAGNRTRVFRVTGGDTDHYTTEDCTLLGCSNTAPVHHRPYCEVTNFRTVLILVLSYF